jgi:hypothetical protein
MEESCFVLRKRDFVTPFFFYFFSNMSELFKLVEKNNDYSVSITLNNMTLEEGVRQINWKNPDLHEITCIHLASNNGLPKILGMLLAHPSADVNIKDQWGCTPFYHACWNNKADCLKVLLKSERVDVDEPRVIEGKPWSPLKVCVHGNRIELVKIWIASGRELKFRKGVESEIFYAQNRYFSGMEILLKRFREFPEKVRAEIQKEIGWSAELC